MRSPRTSGAPCTFFVMPDLTTSRSISSTGFPARAPSDLEADLAEALALEPEHLSCYELEAKPGTRFTHAHGAELERQAESMETYFERVVETLTGAGYRWYETANFCRLERRGRDLRARHNLGYWLGRDYLGLGVGAVSTIDGLRRRNAPRLAAVPRGAGRGPAVRSASSSRSTTSVRPRGAAAARAPARRAAAARRPGGGARPRRARPTRAARAWRSAPARTATRRSRSPSGAVFSAAVSPPSSWRSIC